MCSLAVVEAVRPHRTDGHGEAWQLLAAYDGLQLGVEGDLTGVKIAGCWSGGVEVPCRTVQRYIAGPSAVGGGEDTRCGWPTGSRARSCRSTSVAWASCSTR